MRLQRSRRPWPIGTLHLPTAAARQRPRIELNRYPRKIIGLALFTGGRRYLSWVWPVWIVDIGLTREQFDRQVREVIDTTEGGR